MLGSLARRLRLVLTAILLAAGWCWAPDAARAETQISVVLVTEPGFSPSWQQQWYTLFTALKVDNLQIRTLNGSERPLVEQQGTSADLQYRVIGVLGANNELRLPGGRFKSNDRHGIGDWLKKLREGGPAAAEGAPPAAFNLTRDELQTVQAELSKPIIVQTKELKPLEAINKIATQIKLPIVLDDSLKEKLPQAQGFGDELDGVTAGTALACLLRPQGMVLVPRRDAKRQLQLAIVPSKGATEVWPVGWKPEKPDTEVMPDMFENLNVEVDDIPLNEVLDIIGNRLKLPVLYDHNALAKHAIDPTKINITFPSTRTIYALALRKMLIKHKLKFELRVDDAKKPLMWVTTTMP